MAIDSKDRPVAAVDAEKISKAYEDLMAVEINLITIPSPPQTIQEDAATEARTGFVSADENMLTNGIYGLLRRVVNSALNEAPAPGLSWNSAMRAFRETMRPYKEDFDAIEKLDSRLEAIEVRRQERLDGINAQARANHAYFSAETNKTDYEERFEARVAELGGRTINTFTLSPFYPLLMILIGITEFKLNFDFIDQWMNTAPAVSVAMSVLIGGLIAWSSHVWGGDLKQWNSKFGDAADHPVVSGVILFLSTVIAIIGFVVVATSRAAIVGATMGGSVLDQQGGGIDPMASVWVSVGVNVGIWILGIIISYFSHDEDAECVTLYSRKWWWTWIYRWRDRRWAKMKRKVEAQIVVEKNAARNAAAVASRRHPAELAYFQQVKSRESDLFSHLATFLDMWVSKYRAALLAEFPSTETIKAGQEDVPISAFKARCKPLTGEILSKIMSP